MDSLEGTDERLVDLEENIGDGADGYEGLQMEGIGNDKDTQDEADEVPEGMRNDNDMQDEDDEVLEGMWDDNNMQDEAYEGMGDDMQDEVHDVQWYGHLSDSEDSYDSDEGEDEWTEYFNWEENFFVSKRFLTDWSVIQMQKPGQIPFAPLNSFFDLFEEVPRSNSIIGPSWERMKVGRILMTQEEIETERVSYEQLYKLSVQNVKMLAAWKKRKEKTKASWDVKKVEDLLRNLKKDPDRVICHRGVIQEAELVESCIDPEVMTPTERVKYSVGKLMHMLGSSAQLNELTNELNQVKNWLSSQMMKSLNSCLPVSLPYPAMTSLFKSLYDVNNSAEVNTTPQLGMMDSSEDIKLVQEKYLVRLYLSMVDVYNVLREIMFRHPALTRPMDFSQTFQFMRSRVMMNLNSMKMLILVQSQEAITVEASPPFEPRSCFHFENESIESNTSTNDVNLFNGYIVTITDYTGTQLSKSHLIKIFNTETRKVENVFPVTLKPCSTKCQKASEIHFKCCSMVEDLILLSSDCPRLILINWKAGEIKEEIRNPITVGFYRNWSSSKQANFLSKDGEKVWIVQEDRDNPFNGFNRTLLKVFEAGKKGSQFEVGRLSKPSIITVMMNWLVISTKCDEPNLKSIQWINLHTYQVISEDLYPVEKMPRIAFDSSRRYCNEETLKFVQTNNLGKVELWKIEPSGQKQFLQQFGLKIEEVTPVCNDKVLISYSHPYILMTSKPIFMREDFEIIDAHKVCLYELNEEMEERQAIFYSNCSVKMCAFYMFEFPVGKMTMNLGNEVLVMMTKTETKQRVPFGSFQDPPDKLRIKWSRFDFGKGGLGVISEDVKMAEEVLENVQKAKIKLKRYWSSESQDETKEILEEGGLFEEVASQLSNNASWKSRKRDYRIAELLDSEARVLGQLVEWHKNVGYLMSDCVEDCPKILLHVGDIKNPFPILTAGMKLEFSISETEEEYGNQIKAVNPEIV